MSQEQAKWKEAKRFQSDEPVTFGPHFSFQFRNTPRRVLFALSRYKFAAKMIGENKSILEIGCSEGYGTPILAESALSFVGIDSDEEAITAAKAQFTNSQISFKNIDLFDANVGLFDAVVSFDVIEHIYPDNETDYFVSIINHTNKYGVCIIGTPNLSANEYASAHSQEGHVNMYTGDRLKNSMETFFHNVFLFSMNDEVIHTGFYPMAHYLIGMGVTPKEEMKTRR